jgi:hypothetical protein
MNPSMRKISSCLLMCGIVAFFGSYFARAQTTDEVSEAITALCIGMDAKVSPYCFGGTCVFGGTCQPTSVNGNIVCKCQ